MSSSERELHDILRTLQTKPPSDHTSLLTRAKLLLLKSHALTPTPSTSQSLLHLARSIFETGALLSIRSKDAEAFTRYRHQLGPFYDLPAARYGERGSGADEGERKKITGLYLLLLLTKGDYAGFHTELEGLQTGMGSEGDVEGDRYLGYPVRLERWLMEGSYDQVWKAMARGEVPCEEYGVFSEILIPRIRAEIASCSERAYPSLPISSTKNLLFLESEGAVVHFAQSRGWIIKDGRIYFPMQAEDGSLAENDEKEVSEMAIQNTLGYARELETIV